MPSGSLVAGFSKRALPNGINTLREIVFWERNGLRHGEFTLPFDDEIVNLDFSLDSTLLALHCVSQDKKHSVQIYYRSKRLMCMTELKYTLSCTSLWPRRIL